MNQAPGVRRTAFLAVVLLGFPLSAFADDKPTAGGVEFFEKKVRPLLVKHCYSCHSAEAKKLSGELRLDTRDGVLQRRRVRPGRRARRPGEEPAHPGGAPRRRRRMQMPPKEKLSDAEIADLEAWVKMGAPTRATGGRDRSRSISAKGRDVLVVPAGRDDPPPPVKDEAWPLNPIDRFVLAKLRRSGPEAGADRRQADADPPRHLRPDRAAADAGGDRRVPRRRLAGRLREGGRPAARVAGLRRALGPALARRGPLRRHRRRQLRLPDPADRTRTATGSSTPFNRDLPYDQFVREQLAGDLLPATDEADRHAKLIATGYLANARRFGSYEDARYPWYLTFEDTDRQPRPDVPRADDQLRPLPRPQVRPDLAGGLLRPVRHLPEHALPAGRASSWTRCSATSCRSRRRTRSSALEKRAAGRSWPSSTPRSSGSTAEKTAADKALDEAEKMQDEPDRGEDRRRSGPRS